MRADRRLFLSYLVLIGALVLALSLGADRILRRHLTAQVEQDLGRELLLAQALYEASPHIPPDSLADLIGRLSARRVTIVADDGTVTGDSNVPRERLAEVENHAARPEIRQALQGERGRAFRLSPTVGTEHIYLAMPTARGDVLRLAVPVRDINRIIARVQRGIAGVGLAALLLAALFSLGFSFAVTRPLRRMSGVARAMAAGDLSLRLAERRGDELGELAAALDTLAAELQRRLTELERERAETQALIDAMAEGVIALRPHGTVRYANPAARQMFGLRLDPEGLPPAAVARQPEFLRLVERVLRGEPVPPIELADHRRRLLATGHPLPDAGAVLVFLDVTELRRLESVRRDFVANASHELKTPLTAIRGYSETLLDPELPPALREQFATAVKTNADRLQRIVDDLLDLSRIESGRWSVQPERIVIADVAREAWSALDAAAREKGVEFRLSIPAGSGDVLADEGALGQIFDNLFSNALRYTPAGGHIEVTARCRDLGAGTTSTPEAVSALPGFFPEETRWIAVTVRDTGTGIPAPALPRIFERFYRVDPARSRAEGGTGLGLAIARHLVEAHGGQITAESRLGEGTTIRFTLPAAIPSRTT